MSTMYQRGRARDRATHIVATATAPAPLLGDEFDEPWMAPSRRATVADARRPWTMPRRSTLADAELESLYNETPEPLFDKSPIASRVIGIALAIGAIAAIGAVFWP